MMDESGVGLKMWRRRVVGKLGSVLEASWVDELGLGKKERGRRARLRTMSKLGRELEMWQRGALAGAGTGRVGLLSRRG